MKFTNFLDIYCLKTQQTLNIEREKAWEFFSSPENLSKITPARMKFNITTKKLDKIYTGQIIDYKVNILPFVRRNWRTLISKVIPNELFIDEQKIGPYEIWHHQHYFKENGNKTVIEDIVHFKIPFGVFGKILFSLVIKKQLTDIFTYRSIKIDSLFNTEKTT